MPKISVILPVYNNQKTVLASIKSILCQTYSDFELIVINDGSSDGTDGILKTLSDPRIRMLGDHMNMGLPRRLNQGIEAAKGEYIARMDADDIAFPERFAKQVLFLDGNPEIDLLATRAATFNSDGYITGLLPFAQTHSEITKQPWNSIPMPHPTWMARREWLLKYGYALPEIWRAEDQDLLLRAYKKSHFACLPDVLLCYYQGSFQYKKVRLARWYLFKAQHSFFCSHHQYIFALFSLAVFSLKSITDVLRAIPFLESRIKLFRKNDPLPEVLRSEAQKLVQTYLSK